MTALSDALTGSAVDHLLEGLLAAAGAALFLVLGRRRPLLLGAGYLAVMCFLPIWCGVKIRLYLEPQVAFGLLVLVVLVPQLRRLRTPVTAADLLVGLFVLACVAPLATGSGTLSSAAVAVLQYLGAYLVGRLLPAVVGWGRLLKLVLLLFSLLAVATLAEHVSGLNVFHSLPGAADLHAQWGSIQMRGGVPRAEGAFGHSIALGATLAMGLPLALAAPVRAWVRVLAVVLLLAAVVVTFSRTGLLTACLGALLSVVVARDLPGRLRVGLLGVGAAVAVVAVPLLTKVFLAAGTEATNSAAYRGSLLALLRDIDLLGASSALQRTANGEVRFGTFGSIDNALIYQGLTYGWLSLAVVLVLLALAVGAVLCRRAGPATIAVAAQVPAFVTVALITQYATFVWFVGGLAVWSQAAAKARRTSGAEAPTRFPLPGERGADLRTNPDNVNGRAARGTSGGGAIVNLRGYLDVVARRWRSMVAAVVLCTGAGVVLSATATPVYSSSASLYFSLQSATSANELAQGSTFTQNQMASYANLATTAQVLDPVIAELDLPTDARTLAGRVSVTTPSATVVLQVAATSTSPTEAAAIANSVARHLSGAVAGVAPLNAKGDAAVRGTLVAPASVPRSPVSPRTALDIVVGALLGVLLAILWAVVREALDTRVRGAEDVQALTPAPLLVTLPVDEGATDRPVLQQAPRSPQAEIYRQLRTATQFLRIGGRRLAMVVTSAMPGEGKSTVAVNLALALSETSDRVLLVDADLRRPTLAKRLEIEGSAGLSTVLAGRARFEDVVQEWGPGRLAVLTAGLVPPNPAELLSSAEMAELVGELRQRYDVVIWDSAPLLPVTDGQLLAGHADGVLLVASARTVRRPQLAEALESLRRVEARVLGVVLNMVPVRERVATYGYGVYGSGKPDPRRGRRPLARLSRRGRRLPTQPSPPVSPGSPSGAGARLPQPPVPVPAPASEAVGARVSR